MTPENPAALARELIDVVGGLNDRLDKAEASEHRIRVVLRVTGAALAAVTIALAVVAFFLARSNSDRIAADVARSAADRAKQAAQCQNINKTRAENREIWGIAVAVDTAEARTAAEKALVRKMAAQARVFFADEDCSRLAS